MPFGSWIMNTLIYIVVLATVGAVASATLVAYSFARFRYRGRDMFFMLTLATLMLPAQVTLIPQYILFLNLGWIDTLCPLIVPQWFGGGAFNIFLMRQFIMSIPRDLDEAALVDGASYSDLWTSCCRSACRRSRRPRSSRPSPLGRLPHAARLPQHPGHYTVALGLSFFRNYPGDRRPAAAAPADGRRR